MASAPKRPIVLPMALSFFGHLLSVITVHDSIIDLLEEEAQIDFSEEGGQIETEEVPDGISEPGEFIPAISPLVEIDFDISLAGNSA